MTGRYEEPETRRESNPASPSAEAATGTSADVRQQDPDASPPAANGVEGHQAPDYGDGPVLGAQYVDPKTTPARPYPGSAEHPPPSYVDPAQSVPQPMQQASPPPAGYVTGDAPKPYNGGVPHAQVPGAGQAVNGPYADPSQSGPQPFAQPGPQSPSQSQPASQPGHHQGPPPGQQAAPYYFEASPSGPQQAQSGPYPVAGTQSGPHQVSGAVPGPVPPAGEQSGPYVVGQPYPMQGQPYPMQGQPGSVPTGQSGPVQPGQHPFPAQPQAPGAAGPGDQSFGQDLSSAQLLRPTKRPPQSGWRRAVYVASGHSINLGESSSDLRRRELISRVNQPLHGCYKIAMLSLKGGVGKTTTTATLGSTFSSLRGDRVIAVDANPDRGTLSQKIPLETTATVRHLLRDAQHVRKYSDVRAYTSQGPSRLEILASEQDPAVSEAFSEDDYRRTITLLEHFYNVVLTDCGTGLMHSAMKGVLDIADSLVIVSSSSIDGARSASATLDWLDAHGYGELVGRSVAVINSVRPGSGKVDVDKLSAHFNSRCRAVSKIPFDAHLEEGAEVELDQLAAPTRLALLELAAIVADDFPQVLGRQRPN